MLPLPAGAKWPPPSGYTGWAGIEPSGPDVQAWVDGPEGAGNVTLRLGPGLYGLDVDQYGGKTGGDALAKLEIEAGEPLPATWVTSARDGVSGIRMFRAALPPGRRWRDVPAGRNAGIEAVHTGHRYAVVWPSTNPEAGGATYRWRRPDGTLAEAGDVPSVDGLPELPAAWVEILTEPGEARIGEMAGHSEAIEAVTGWRDGDACPRVAEASTRALVGHAAAAAGAALHPASVAGVHELTNLGHEGHAGVRRALAEHHDAHVRVRQLRGETQDAAVGEWWRAVRGAIGKLPASTRREVCDCGLWAGDGLLFDPTELAGLPAGGDLFEGPAPIDGDAMVIEGAAEPVSVEAPRFEDLHYAEILDEGTRLRIRDIARERYDAFRHARTWVEPRSHGSLADELLLPDEDPQWRIHGLLGNGHNAVLIAGRKTGKTTMVNEFVRAYVDGEPFLGAQEVVPPTGGIAIFNYEVDERQYRRWLRDVGIRNTHKVHVLHLRGRSLSLANGRVRTWVADWLRERQVTGWVVDPYSRAYVGSVDNGNDEAQVGAFLDTLDVIKAEAGVNELVMPVHTPKGRVDEGEETAIGSQRLEAWPDVMWYLTRDGKTRFIRAEGRDVEFKESALEFSESTRRLTVEIFGQSRAQRRDAERASKLIDYVRKNPECTQNDIMDALKWNGKTVGEAVAAAGGQVVVERGPNRAKIHILKTDIPGVTQNESHTASDRVTPGSGEWCDSPVGESPPPPAGVTNDSRVTPTPLKPFNQFDLVGDDLGDD